MTYEDLNKDFDDMNTKKAILLWWEQLGSITKRINDLESFYECISNTIQIARYNVNSHCRETVILYLRKPHWKYSLVLNFFKKECIRIRGF